MDKPRVIAYSALFAASIATMVMGGSHPSTTASPKEPVRVVRIGGNVGGYEATSSVPAPFTAFTAQFSAPVLAGPVAMTPSDPSLERVAKRTSTAPPVAAAPKQAVSGAPASTASPATTTSPLPTVSSLSDVTNQLSDATGTVTDVAATVLPSPSPTLSALTGLLP
ncbi:MAG: hypothetical protein ACXVQ5_11940 [Actinomycetota bacterium]